MRALICAVLALLLAACASQAPAPHPLLAERPRTSVVVAGTLAPLGSFEWQVAPVLTRLIATRQRAALMLDRGRIDAAAGHAVLTHTDAARAALNRAIDADKQGQAGAAGLHVNEALQALARADRAMQGKP